MFFIFRAVFWISLALLLVPADWRKAVDSLGTPTTASRSVTDHGDRIVETAVGAAETTIREADAWCARNAIACAAGRVAVDGAASQAGRWVQEKFDTPAATTASTVAATPVATTASTAPRAGDAERRRGQGVPLPHARPVS
jgi:hypothetical protein